MRQAFLASLLLLLVGCSSLSEKSMQLSPGLSTQQALKIVGPPELRSFQGDLEVWQYAGFINFDHCAFLTLWFKQGQLDRLTSHQQEISGRCQSHLQPINLPFRP